MNHILTHEISCKKVMGAKPLRMRIDKIDGIINIYNRTIYLELFGFRIYNTIYDSINYLISDKKDAKILLIIILQESELIHVIIYL